jgi:hypothetical protein
MFSITTIASSTTRREAEERQRVDRKAEQLHERERADERHRNRDHRYERHLPVLNERVDHEDDEQDRRRERYRDFFDRFPYEQRRVERDDVRNARREGLRQLRERRANLRRDVERVRVLRLDHAETDRVVPVPMRGARIVFRSEFHAADVGDSHGTAVGIAPNDDVRKLRGRGEPAAGVELDLIELFTVRRCGADRARGDLLVLARNRREHVARR